MLGERVRAGSLWKVGSMPEATPTIDCQVHAYERDRPERPWRAVLAGGAGGSGGGDG